jgi:hypothetical protein
LKQSGAEQGNGICECVVTRRSLNDRPHPALSPRRGRHLCASLAFRMRYRQSSGWLTTETKTILLLPSDGKGTSNRFRATRTRLLQTTRARTFEETPMLSLSHRMGEGRGEGLSACISQSMSGTLTPHLQPLTFNLQLPSP